MNGSLKARVARIESQLGAQLDVWVEKAEPEDFWSVVATSMELSAEAGLTPQQPALTGLSEDEKAKVLDAWKHTIQALGPEADREASLLVIRAWQRHARGQEEARSER